ncbi:MAG: DNA integrity scanning diadenylate cyclase DisA [Bacillota bacterium]|nr:DNA integrity scanning diadenylate cyclase DisA [Bacillota bacterium]
MKSGPKVDKRLLRCIKMLAPGTQLHEGLESILRARTGALIVVGDSEAVMKLVDGGFRIDSELHPSSLYELAKMDGAIILSQDASRIIYANAHLTPDPLIPSTETGTRHRTAERVAIQTGELVIAISQRRNVITLYQGQSKYILRDLGVVLAKANQALQTLEKYRKVLEQALTNLSAVEFQDLVTAYDVAVVIQRAQMVARIVDEVETYICELGEEGRLVELQLDELVLDIEDEGLLVIRDYAQEGAGKAEKIWEQLGTWSAEELLDHGQVMRALGYAGTPVNLDQPVTPRGYRILSKIPRLPLPVIENLVQRFQRLQRILEATVEELDDVEGIGEVRARAIKDGLHRLREQVLLERHL